jgi:hypothetical protein
MYATLPIHDHDYSVYTPSADLCCICLKRQSPEEREAEIRLKKAAPEMLAELKVMHREFLHDCDSDCPTFALIERAEGRV